MPDISLLQFVRAVRSTTLLGMAQKVGVKPPPPPISVRNLLANRTFDPGFITSDRPLGGSINIRADSRGQVTINGSFHNSGFDNIDYTVTVVLVTPSFKAFTFQHSGHTEGTSAGLPFGTPNRDDNFLIPTAENPLIAQDWPDVFGATMTAAAAGTDTLVGGLVGALDSLLNEALKAAGQALGKAGAAAIIALF